MPTTSIFENQSQRLCKGFGFFEQQSLKNRNQQKKTKNKNKPTTCLQYSFTYLVQLPAETLKNVMLVDLENRLPLIEDSMHDHAQRIHVRGSITAN